ncbi:ABC transporter permease [Mesorhizobium sp. CN2-181]|uniref:ABC transporter permease n=1 Tax=Mesorhizobium yinganensis TaxID=3157707 RepID=UPI0032B7923F
MSTWRLKGRLSLPAILFCLAGAFAAAFALLSPEFLNRANLISLQRSVAVELIIGLAQLAVLAIGGVNIAVGATGVAAAMAAGWLMQEAGTAWLLALPAALLLGTAIGATSGYVVVRTRTNSFIITLTMTTIVFGAMVVATKATGFNRLPTDLTAFARLRLAGGYVTPLFAIALLASGLVFLVLNRTVTGREILMTGANPRAAHASGIATRKLVVFCHAASGLLAAIAGIVLMLRNNAAIPSMAGNLGQEWLLSSFIIPILGGASLFGGRASVAGCIGGALLFAVLRSGLLTSGINDFLLQMIFGLLLLATVVAGQMAAARDEWRG